MLSNTQKIVALFETVRDIPYGDIGSRDPFLVLKKRRGTCSGKHQLLGFLYQAMGVPVRYMMCRTSFQCLKNILPDSLKQILESHDIVDYHNYLLILMNKWLVVDVTFDRPLARYGFPVNDNWDGLSNCTIAFPPIKVFQVKDMIEEKHKAINALPEEEQELRSAFIKQLSEWMDSLRKTTPLQTSIQDTP